MHRTLSIFLALFLLALAACTPTQTENIALPEAEPQLMAAEPGSEPAQVIEAAELPAEPAQVIEVTEVPAEPTRHVPATPATDTALPTSTPPPAPTASPEPPIQVAIPEGHEEGESWTSISPDGNWVAYGQWLFAYDGQSLQNYRMLLTIGNSDQSVQWTVADRVENVGLGAPLPKVLHWGNDGQSVYITDLSTPDGWGDCELFSNGYNLSRVDLISGQVTPIVSESSVLSISQDESLVAVINSVDSQNMLNIYDLATGQAVNAPLNLGEFAAGRMVWSPNNQNIAFLREHPQCSAGGYDLMLWGLENQTLEPILEHSDSPIYPVEWESDDTLLVRDQEDSYWRYSLLDGTLTPISAP